MKAGEGHRKPRKARASAPGRPSRCGGVLSKQTLNSHDVNSDWSDVGQAASSKLEHMNEPEPETFIVLFPAAVKSTKDNLQLKQLV